MASSSQHCPADVEDCIRIQVILDLQREVKKQKQEIQNELPQMAAAGEALLQEHRTLSNLQEKLQSINAKRASLLRRLTAEVNYDGATDIKGGSYLVGKHTQATACTQSCSLPHTPPSQMLSHELATAAPPTEFSSNGVEERHCSFSPNSSVMDTYNSAQLRAQVKKRLACLAQELVEMRRDSERMATCVCLTHAEIRTAEGFNASAAAGAPPYNSLSQTLRRRHDREGEGEARQLIHEVTREIAHLNRQLHSLSEEERKTTLAAAPHPPLQAAKDDAATAIATTEAAKRSIAQLEREAKKWSRALSEAEKQLRQHTRERERWSKAVSTLEERLRTLRQQSTVAPEVIEVMRRHTVVSS